MIKSYKLIQTEDQYQDLLTYLSKYEYIAYDVESTQLNTRKCTIVGIGISGCIGTGYYIELYTWNVDKQTLVPNTAMISKMPGFLALISKKYLIAHNASYDIRATYYNFGVNLTDSLYADTLMMAHTCAEDSKLGLKDLAESIKGAIGYNVEESAKFEKEELLVSIQKNGGSTTKTNMEMYKADLDKLYKYCCSDVDNTLRIFDYFSRELEREGLEDFYYTTEVIPLIKEVVIPMEMHGIKLDIPKMQQLLSDISSDMLRLEDEVQIEIAPYVANVEQRILNKERPITRSGHFAQALVRKYAIALPLSKSGSYSLTAVAISKAKLTATEKQRDVLEFLSGNDSLPIWLALELRTIQKELYLSTSGDRYVFNIQSKHHLIDLFYTEMGNSTNRKTNGGSMKMDEEELERLAKEYKAAFLISEYNKLMKIKSTYIERFLEASEDGEFYQQFKPHGTISGRGSGDLQQLTKPSEEGQFSDLISKYRDEIRAFFICKDSRKFIDNDFSQLEVRIFASDAGDEPLIKVFENNEDIYSKVAIEIYGLQDKYSAKKDAENYLGKKAKLIRQAAKAYVLGIRYGEKAFKLSYELDISETEAQDIIDNYFKSFPKLKQSMDRAEMSMKTKGYVQSRFGRIRHLKEGREIWKKFGKDLMDYRKQRYIASKHGISVDELKQIRKRYNNLLNNAFNFPIQAAAASITNRAAVAMMRKYKEEGIDAKICLILHDQIIVDVDEKSIDRAAIIMRECMEGTTKLGNLDLEAIPQVAKNFKEGH